MATSEDQSQCGLVRRYSFGLSRIAFPRKEGKGVPSVLILEWNRFKFFYKSEREVYEKLAKLDLKH